jgi:uncharacterized protein (DUF952 family)
MADPEHIYKVAARDLVAAARAAGVFAGAPVDLKDGFIHFSTAAQLAETLRLHFAGQEGLVLLAVRTADIAAKLKWEPSRGGELFPHLYAALPMSAVVRSAPIAVAADGTVTLPDWVR